MSLKENAPEGMTLIQRFHLRYLGAEMMKTGIQTIFFSCKNLFCLLHNIDETHVYTLLNHENRYTLAWNPCSQLM